MSGEIRTISEKQRRLLSDTRTDLVLLTDPANMRYLTGFTGEGYVLLTAEQATIVTDARYTVAARNQCPDCKVMEWNKIGYYKPVMEAVKDRAVRTVGFEDMDLSVSAFRQFEKRLKKYAVCKPVGDKADRLRQVKTREEIACIREAEAIGDRAFARLMLDLGVPVSALGVPGQKVAEYHTGTSCTVREISEKQIAARLEYYLKDEGGEKLSFDTIAASGTNGALPHAVPTDRIPSAGELLTLDFGCVYRGYCSDMTRTVAVGHVSGELKDIYELVKQAQQTALSGIRPGMCGREIDALSRDVIRDGGYGKEFGHSLGHSVGLKIHERPGFTPKEKTVIEPGMVISVEPGIYVEDLGGVRIEDLVVITEDGIDNLSASVKELLILP